MLLSIVEVQMRLGAISRMHDATTLYLIWTNGSRERQELPSKGGGGGVHAIF